MVPGTSGHHPGNHPIAVHARPRRWDLLLLGAPRQWHEAAGEGYAPPCEIGHHQPVGRPLNQGPAAVEEVPICYHGRRGRLPWNTPRPPSARRR